MLVPRFSTFLKSYLEQVEACTNQEFDIQFPKHNLPSQILCQVVYMKLKAELETDEVFAQVTLLPEMMVGYSFNLLVWLFYLDSACG